MHRINPYLSFDGDCAEAFRFYSRLFDSGEPMMMTYDNSPMADQMPAKAKGKIMHAQIEIGGVTLMGADAACETPEHPERAYAKPRGFCVTVNAGTPAEADRLFSGLAEGGVVVMPIAETFWAHRFGMATDRFGIPWMVNCLKASV